MTTLESRHLKKKKIRMLVFSDKPGSLDDLI